jgi:outer membrane protein TolC
MSGTREYEIGRSGLTPGPNASTGFNYSEYSEGQVDAYREMQNRFQETNRISTNKNYQHHIDLFNSDASEQVGSTSIISDIASFILFCAFFIWLLL